MAASSSIVSSASSTASSVAADSVAAAASAVDVSFAGLDDEPEHPVSANVSANAHTRNFFFSCLLLN